MHYEEIEYYSFESNENTHINKIRNIYFENRRCFTNVLDFLDQEVVIMPSSYFTYCEGPSYIIQDDYISDFDLIEDDEDRADIIFGSLEIVDSSNGYHLSVLDSYITIIAQNRRCIFTNRDMKEGKIVGTIVWIKNFKELLKKYSDRNLKRVSKAIVCPLITKPVEGEEKECLDAEFFLSMDIYYPEVAFKYTFDTYMSNVCIEVYSKLVKSGLNGLVDRYIPIYKQCDGYGKKGIENYYSTEICKCGGLRAFCYLNI